LQIISIPRESSLFLGLFGDDIPGRSVLDIAPKVNFSVSPKLEHATAFLPSIVCREEKPVMGVA
jgi:hypothetical protein